MRYKQTAFLMAAFALTAIYSCHNHPLSPGNDGSASTPAVTNIDFVISAYYPHDSSLFTEGFLFHNGQLFESTGSPDDLPNAKSLIGITDLATGKFEKKIELDRQKFFGEGIVFLNRKLFQLTYKNQLGFIYDAQNFKPLGNSGTAI